MEDKQSGNGTLAAAGWRLKLLDGWQLTADDEVVPVALREQRLLAALALLGQRPRSYLSGVLWPESGEQRAQANLRAAVWRIHHHTPEVLEEGNGMLELAPAVSVDVHELRAVSRHISASSADLPDADVALPLLRHSTLLPGWYDDWVLEEREQLHQLRLRALEALARRLVEAGDIDNAIQAAMCAATIEPLRESAHRMLIRVHLVDGNHVEAIRVFRSFRDRLRSELGITVSQQIVDLVRPLLADRAEDDGRRNRTAPRAGRRSR